VRHLVLAFCLLAALLTAPVQAGSRMAAAPLANVQLADPEQEKQARSLMETVRCLVCQGQSIADSDADMAGDMRALIRERIQKGESPEQVRAWLVERYGDWVTYAPPQHGVAALLWALPAVLILIGGFVAAGRIRRRRG
jgi:cytochrome c-type biogenesis protein CcmH